MQPATAVDFELKQRMAWRQRNVIAHTRVPTADEQPPRIRIDLDLADQPFDLIDAVRLRIIAAKRAPQIAVNRAEIAGFAAKSRRLFLGRPFGPNIDAASE